jgi:hypothetical protein
MKKLLIAVVILAAMVSQGFAQEKLKIGEVVNGKLKITREADLRSFLLNNINKSGTLAKEIRVEVSPTADRFLAFLKVTGNKTGISCAGVMLVNINNEAFIVRYEPDAPVIPGIGGSATYTCAGAPCTDCEISATWPSGSWLPNVSCYCAAPEGECNMTISVTFSLKIGLL